MLKRKLLTILFICILLPIVITLIQSAVAIINQRDSIMRMSADYAESLANYASERWDEGNMERIVAFLSLVADRGHDGTFTNKKPGPNAPRRPFGELKNQREKFIPGLVAYINIDGSMISYSKNAGILFSIFKNAPLVISEGQMTRRGTVINRFQVGGDNVTYVAHIAPTNDAKVYAVAAVTLRSWMGQNEFSMLKLAIAGTFGMIFCLIALFLLRSSVILPIQSLSNQVDTLEWGKETPDTAATRLSGWSLEIDEISSLKNAVNDLAKRMVEKDELEKRYVMDILQAQEDERTRMSRDIHDGPIQVVSALIQRIQMACVDSDDKDPEVIKQLDFAEKVAVDLVEDLRNICDSLVPPWVTLGFVSCMEEAAARFAVQHEVEINMNVDNNVDLPDAATLALFRIFQECVSNAVRHGAATVVDVDITCPEDNRDGLVFRIADNGSGFDYRATDLNNLFAAGKRGLNGINQRVSLLGGELHITSSPGEGTVVNIVL